MKSFPFKFLRILILLFILIAVWTTTISQKRILQNWQGTNDIVIIPIAADGDKTTTSYLKRLAERDFNQIRNFFKREIKRYRPELSHTMSIKLLEQISNSPPLPPQDNPSKLNIIFWSLKLRWWAWQNRPDGYHSQQIRLYVLYNKPVLGKRLPHSTGLQKGLIGIIHAFAGKQNASHNNLIIAHELLHIFGATDKYDLKTGLAIRAEGYAEPNRKPLYPQRFVEIMGRTIPRSQTSHSIGDRLSLARINAKTAKEIGLTTSP